MRFLMELREPPDERAAELIPAVLYSASHRTQMRDPDYWDYATLLELAVLAKNRDKAESALQSALALVREPWEPKTTSRNLRLIRESRENRKEIYLWAREIEERLQHEAKA